MSDKSRGDWWADRAAELEGDRNDWMDYAKALKTENESLRGQLEDADEQVVALEKQVKALMREYEPMRKDAERYRWLMRQYWWDQALSAYAGIDADPPEIGIDAAIRSQETH